MIDRIIDICIARGKVCVFIFVAACTFVIAFSVFIVISLPAISSGIMTAVHAFAGAIGCGIGAAAVYATICAFEA